MRRDGVQKLEATRGPWLGLFACLALAVICAIAVLSWSPGPTLQTLQPDLSAPQIAAPAAPSAMR